MYNHSIYLYHINYLSENFGTALSIGATTTSKEIEIKSCVEHLLTMFSFCVLQPASSKHEIW